MYRLPRFSRRARWAVPAGALAATGAVMAGALISTAQASPALPARTAAQLLAAVAGRTGPPPAFTGTVVETASLGLPDLPGTSDPTSITSQLTGSHTIRIWYANPSHVRLAVPGTMSESDMIVNGRTAWYWQSMTNSVTRYLLPARPSRAEQTPGASPGSVAMTPQQAATQALAAVGPTTRVSVQSNVMVAGEPAYQLVLAPKSASSLVGQVRIAIDAARDVPLRVQVYARGAANPAFQVGFTSVSFVQPAAANFAFTPPSGAKVKTVTLGRSGGSGDVPAMTPSADGAPTVIGNGWLAVAVLPSSALSVVPGGSGSASSAGRAASSAAQAASGSSPGGGGAVGGEDAAIFGALMQSAAHVHGAWGSGRLLRTSLLSVLITSVGHVLVGAVAPSVLYADAAQANRVPVTHAK